jgi:hypothetical protein
LAIAAGLAAASVGVLVGLPLVGPLGRRLGATAAIVAGFAVFVENTTAFVGKSARIHRSFI